ncbi:hypothetical protein CCOS865_02194 [Pseudomonas reidholzensis]|uniref:Lysozyme inhibitor LprI N-terminal domain-containing protein n=1 Tax=Pseudomonas reidholzensis TaxID=1785162 RepID=A0A383RU77_9PSED|nr:hypothetical protein [Pseudomonas reidholzensis]SYX89928.1 hypothetical protein CCOS865_02194 [Pseudomonas reidholzensis]
MRKHLLLALLAPTLWMNAAFADPTYIEKMSGLTAVCTIDAISQQLEVNSAARKYGEGSKKWSDAFHHRLSVVRSCADDAKNKGKVLYKAEAERLPALKPELAEMYVSWLGYLDHLTDEDRDSYQRAYELSANRLKASVDAI